MEIWEESNALAHPFFPNEFSKELGDEVRNVHLQNAETFVLEDGGRLIGFIAMIGEEIGGLFVDPAAIGRGYGKALVDHVVSQKGPLSVEVFEENAVGRPFYERYGFVLESTYVHEPTGMTMFRMAMPQE